MSNLVIYHGGCWDGFCAAWILRNNLSKDTEFLPAQYGDEAPDCTGRIVYVVDFSYKRPVLERMNRQALALVVLDHHKTAEAELRGLNFCTFDMNKSGARLTWEKSAGGMMGYTAPWLVDYTEDRDLWTWNLPSSKEVNAALRSYPLDFDVWNELALRDWSELIPEGKAILRSQQQVIETHVKNAHEVVVDGHSVLCVNATTLVSEIAGELAKDRPFGVTWFEGDNNERVYSLRSREGGVDVSEIAKAHGGGGHKSAAGFRVTATGATGLFTEGQACQDDEGEIKMELAADIEAGLVRLDFGKPVGWLGLPKLQAHQLGEMLCIKAAQLK